MAGLQGTWTLLLVVLPVYWCVTLSTASSIGAVRPVNPYGFINETLNLTCHVTDPDITGNTSGSLYFTNQWDGEERVISLRHLSVLDARTVLLEYLVQSGHDQGPFICKLNQSDGSVRIVDKQYVTVDYRPVPVQHLDCLVYNWKNMTCSWDLVLDYVNKDLLSVQLYWTILGDRWYVCPHNTTTSCTWLIEDERDTLQPDAKYTMVVEVTTKNKSLHIVDDVFSEHFVINASEKVKPSPVEKLTVVYQSSTCISLSWTQPHKYRRFLNKMTWQGSHIWGNDTTTENNLTVCELHPAVQYTFNLSIIPIPPGYTEPKGFYSDETSLNVSSLEDVPSGAPIVHTGSFTYGDCTSRSECDVTIYWRPVQEKARNGRITLYSITVWPKDGSGQVEHLEVEGSGTEYALNDLRKDTDYVVKLRASTEVGFSQKYSSIYVPSRQTKYPHPKNFLVQASGSSLLVSWEPSVGTGTPPTDDNSGYTLYHCTGSASSCRGEIQWHHLSANETSYRLNVTNGILDNKMIGISAEKELANQTVSSGITWNNCIYLKHEKPPQVPNVRFSSEQPDNALLVEWDRINCQIKPVYVTHYVVTHCTGNGKGCEGVPANESVKNNKGSHKIEDLTPGLDYRVTVVAVADAGEGPYSDPISIRVTSNALDSGVIVGLAVGGAFVLVLIISLIVICCRMVKKKLKNLLYKVEVPEMIEPGDVYTVFRYKILCNLDKEGVKLSTEEVQVSSDALSVPATLEDMLSLTASQNSVGVSENSPCMVSLDNDEGAIDKLCCVNKIVEEVCEPRNQTAGTCTPIKEDGTVTHMDNASDHTYIAGQNQERPKTVPMEQNENDNKTGIETLSLDSSDPREKCNNRNVITDSTSPSDNDMKTKDKCCADKSYPNNIDGGYRTGSSDNDVKTRSKCYSDESDPNNIDGGYRTGSSDNDVKTRSKCYSDESAPNNTDGGYRTESSDNDATVSGYIRIGVSGDIVKYVPHDSTGSAESSESWKPVSSPCEDVFYPHRVATDTCGHTPEVNTSFQDCVQTKLCPSIGNKCFSDYIPHDETVG